MISIRVMLFLLNRHPFLPLFRPVCDDDDFVGGFCGGFFICYLGWLHHKKTLISRAYVPINSLIINIIVSEKGDGGSGVEGGFCFYRNRHDSISIAVEKFTATGSPISLFPGRTLLD